MSQGELFSIRKEVAWLNYELYNHLEQVKTIARAA
jgi:hypothetical protein